MLKTLLAAVSALLLSGPAMASTAKFDKSMGPVLKAYLQIQQALAADSVKGVAKAAKKIAKLSKRVNSKSVSGEHAKHYAGLPKKLRTAAKQLAGAKDIAKARELFKALSRPMAMWATMSKPSGVNVVFCSMAKGSWLQSGKAIRNPYYGTKMLKCGEIVSGPGKGKAGGHMHHKHGH